MRNKALAVVVLALITLQSGAAVAANKAECDLDRSMREARSQMLAIEDDAIDAWLHGPSASAASRINVKDGACLPSLDNLGALIQGRFPSFGSLGGFGDIFSAMKDMVCKAADDYLEGLIGSSSVKLGDPYGVFDISVSGSTSGSSTNTDTYDAGGAVRDGVRGAANDRARDAINSLPDKPRTPGIGGASPNAGGSSVSQGVRDAFNNL